MEIWLRYRPKSCDKKRVFIDAVHNRELAECHALKSSYYQIIASLCGFIAMNTVSIISLIIKLLLEYLRCVFCFFLIMSLRHYHLPVIHHNHTNISWCCDDVFFCGLLIMLIKDSVYLFTPHYTLWVLCRANPRTDRQTECFIRHKNYNHDDY